MAAEVEARELRGKLKAAEAAAKKAENSLGAERRRSEHFQRQSQSHQARADQAEQRGTQGREAEASLRQLLEAAQQSSEDHRAEARDVNDRLFTTHAALSAAQGELRAHQGVTAALASDRRDLAGAAELHRATAAALQLVNARTAAESARREQALQAIVTELRAARADRAGEAASAKAAGRAEERKTTGRRQGRRRPVRRPVPASPARRQRRRLGWHRRQRRRLRLQPRQRRLLRRRLTQQWVLTAVRCPRTSRRKPGPPSGRPRPTAAKPSASAPTMLEGQAARARAPASHLEARLSATQPGARSR